MAFLLFFFFLYHLLPNLAASKLCPESIQCGDHFPLHFPFTDTNNPKCGLFPVEGCSDSGNPVIQSQGSSLSGYHILRNISTNKFKILDSSLYHSLSQSQPRCFPFQNISLPEFPFISFSIPSNLTLYLCSNHTFDDIQDYFKNYRSFYENQDCGFPPRTVYYLPPATDVSAAKQSSIPANCEVIQLPIDSSKGNAAQLFDLLTAEFDLEWSVSEACDKCYHEGGQCLLNTMNDFHCEKGCIAALTSTFKILSVLIRRKRAMAKQEHEKDIELFLKNNGNLTPMRYKYSTIKKITKSFGSVYKGQLPDGHLMAVKVLNESNGNGEDFMNEVASISRTSHINIVVLLGFCFEGCKRALIYDFMPNGSLEKFIGNNVAKSVLGWDKMFEIALGIARGLEYLHQGAVLGFSIWTLSLKTFF